MKNQKLELLDIKCARCQRPATLAAVVQIQGDEFAIPLCKACQSVAKLHFAPVPNCNPAVLLAAKSFPPKGGEWYRAPDGLVLGCPRCAACAALTGNVFSRSDDGKLTPSFICPSCGLHLYLTLRDA